MLALAGCAEKPPRAEVHDELTVTIERTISAEEWDAIGFVLGDSMHVRRSVAVAVATPQATVRAAPVLRGVDAWRGIVERYDWPVDDTLRVMSCESGGDPTAANGTSLGLMQINWPWHMQQVYDAGGVGAVSLFDPLTNIAVAYMIWADGRTFAAWDCQP